MKIVLIMIICFLGLGNVQVAYAASASVTISTDANAIVAGETFSAVVSAESSAVISDFEAYISYDPLVLEFVSGGKLVTGGNGLVFISDISNGDSAVKNYELKFKAIKSGNCEIAVADKPRVYGDGDRKEMSVSKNSLKVEILEQTKEKRNENLKVLSILEHKMSPKFSKDITNYMVTVKNSVSQIAIKAVAEDIDSTIEVTGNDSLEEGNNEVKIAVTSKSGNKKIYTITVYRKTKQEEAYEKEQKQQEKEDGTANEKIDGFFVYKKEDTIFFENSCQYTILDAPEGAKIPTGYKKTSIILCSIDLPAYELQSGKKEKEFFIFYAKNEDGEEGFYRYDRKEKTLQRYVGSLSEVADNQEVEEEKQGISEVNYKNKVNQMMVVIFIMVGFLIICLLIIIKLILNIKMGRQTDGIK